MLKFRDLPAFSYPNKFHNLSYATLFHIGNRVKAACAQAVLSLHRRWFQWKMPRMKAARFPELRTRRLVLRAPGEQDIPAWFARATDVEAASLAGDPVPNDISAGERWLARSRQRFADGKAVKWSIDRSDVADAIGTITLSLDATDAKTATLGFVLARAHWGHGLASEAAREVLRHAFENLLLEQVTAEAATRNFASLRILAKLGFKHIESFIDDSDGERCERLALDARSLKDHSGKPALRQPSTK